MLTRADRGLPPGKLDQIKALWAAGDRRGALLIAARFQDLGLHRDAIISAREAYLRPAFQVEIGRDPAFLIAVGLNALQERYGL